MTRGRRVLESLEDDIRDHIERETRDNLDRGMVPEEARRHILGHGAMLVSEAIVAGIVGAAMLTRLLSSFLFDVSALDAIAFATAGTALFGVGVAAAFVPALRAGMADPLKALREQ